MRSPFLSCSAVAALVSLAACAGGAKPNAPAADRRSAPPPSADVRFARAFDGFFTEFLDMHPTFAASGMGLHEHDGKLPGVNASALMELVTWTEEQIETFEAFKPAELGELRRVEREAVLAQLRRERFELTRRQSPTRDPMYYLGDLALDVYITRDYAPLDQRARGVIGIANGTAEHLLAAQANLPGTMPRTWIETALLMTAGHRAFAKKDVAAAFSGLTDEALRAELKAALAAYDGALASYHKFLEAARKNADDGYALGPELFLEMLAVSEGLTIDLARLEQLGAADLDRNLAALERAATAMKKKPAQAVKLVDADRPSTKQLLAVAGEQAAETRQFVVDKQLATIPSDDVAAVEETPAFARWNSAFLSTPGLLEKTALPAFYWISPPDPKWSKAEQRDYVMGRADLLFTTVHELWPGHFLHFLHQKTNPSRALQAFCSYATTEGWAHYAEEMMVEEGFRADDPRARVGMLLNALLRNVRYMSAVGLHGKGMTVDQSTKLFASKAYSDKKTARQQAVRGTFDPGYLNYTLGKLVIRKLRDDWKARQGAAYTAKAFHDKILSYGCAPLPAIRRAMMGDDSPAL